MRFLQNTSGQMWEIPLAGGIVRRNILQRNKIAMDFTINDTVKAYRKWFACQ
jgi:hypothetical protein